MMEISSMQNPNKNKSDHYTKYNYPQPLIKNLWFHIQIKALHSKLYKNPNKSSININGSSSINCPPHNQKMKPNPNCNNQPMASSHYTPPNSLSTKSTITN